MISLTQIKQAGPDVCPPKAVVAPVDCGAATGSRKAATVTRLEPTARPWLAERKDTPICNFSRRARKPEEPTWTESQRDEALASLRRDYIANSAKGPACSVLKTWESMHRRMHDPEIPTYPLTPDKIARVAAAFKRCGYRSFSNYMSRAKEAHVQMFGDWGVDLAMEARRAGRSVNRGRGPVSQRSPLDFDRILEYQKDRKVNLEPLVAGGPVGAHNLIVIGTFFMLREIEASLLLFMNVRLEDATRTVTLKLPCSKTDPAAASVERSWGCLCSIHGTTGCPYHSAKLQSEFLRLLFGDIDNNVELPFFPQRDGSTVDKIRVVETFEQLHHFLNIPYQDEDGARLLGGHSMRLAGARFLSSSGLHLYQVELMARWRSPMLLHYAQTAPLCKITQIYEQARSNSDNSHLLEQIKSQMHVLDNTARIPGADRAQFEERVGILENDLRSLDHRTRQMIQDEIIQVRRQMLTRPSEFIYNISSRTWHMSHTDGMAYLPNCWTTKCGWKFAFSKFTRSMDIPSASSRRCDKCWHDKPDSTSSSDTSESES